MSLVVGASLLTWLAQWTGIYFTLWAFGLERVGWGGAGLLLVTVTLAQAFPVLPGNLVLFQAAAVVPLTASYGVPAAEALAFSVVLQATEAVVGVAVGFLFLIAEGVGFGTLRRQAEEEERRRSAARPGRHARRSVSTGAEDWSDRDHVLGTSPGGRDAPPGRGRRRPRRGRPGGARASWTWVRRRPAVGAPARPPPEARLTLLDVSPPMLGAARERFAGDPRAEVREHDLAEPLPRGLAGFDAVVSGFAIHHLEDDRKRALYAECLRPSARRRALQPRARRVADPRPARRVPRRPRPRPGEEDPSNRLVPAEVQVGWLSELGFADADVLWRWREMALLAAVRPG